MSYGFELLTTEGYVNVTGMRTVRFFGNYDKTGSSGTQTLSGFDSNKGTIFIRIKDGKRVPIFDYNNSTKVFSWDNTGASDPSNYSSNFRIILLENA